MLKWKKINLKDREIFSVYYQSQAVEVADLNFTNMFLWRYARKIEYTIVDDLLYIKTTYPDKKPYLFFPLGKVEKQNFLSSLEKISTESKNSDRALVLKAITKKQLKFLKAVFPGEVEARSERDHFDYIYDLQSLASLRGRKYHKKKNHLNYFINNYNYSLECLNKHNLAKVADFAKFWLEKKDLDLNNKSLVNEYKGIVSVLKNKDVLNCKVCVLKVDEKIAGFSISEPLNSETVLVHIEKADVDYRGSYQFLNKVCLENCWQQFKYVNREEDLGIEGLRKAKLSYHPVSLIEKFRVQLIS